MSTTTMNPSDAQASVKEEKEGASKKKKILTTAAAVAALGVLYFGYETFFYVTTDNAQIRANTLMLSSRVSGFITQVNVDENQVVKQGEVLAQIDSRDYRSKESAALNELEGLRARLTDAKRNFERLQQLYLAGAVSTQQRDTAEMNAKELDKRLHAYESQLDVSKITVSETEIRAPSNGRIAKKTAEVGMLANPGVPLFGFVSDESRWVIANFKETDMDRIHIGEKAYVSVDSIPGKTFNGEVESISPATGATFTLLPPDNATGNFTKVVQRVPVRIKFVGITSEDIELLRAGLSADIKIRVR